jgi:hypothetical protein
MGQLDGGTSDGDGNEDISQGGSPSTGTDFDRAMMEIAASYQSFDHINSSPYRSTLGPFQINLYVSGNTSQYSKIHPETSGARPSIGVGTVIVREVLDAQGGVAKLTLMAKGPKGYDPTLGDWWFGEADPRGTALVVGGVARLGRLADCHGCHVPRATDDYLFGVPKAEQN